MLRSSPLTLPWTTLRLAGRFFVPLALWYTVGQVLRYLLFLGGYHFGLHHAAVPILVISLLVMVTLGVTVAMVHSVKDGLPAVRKRELDESLTAWASSEEESVLDAITRAILPFMIFYLAWSWYSEDAQAFEQVVAGRANSEKGLGAQIEAMGSVSALERHLYVAIALTAAFFALKVVAERIIDPKWPKVGGITVALFEANWTLFGIFTVNKGFGAATDWIHGRVAWAWLGHVTGPLLGWAGALWPSFKDAVLGGLVWLVIAGVILGVESDEATALGKGRVGRGLIAASYIDRPHTPWEVATRGTRDKWLPTLYGVRMVLRGGMLPFAVFCALYMGLEDFALLLQRGVYDVLGPHEVPWWNSRNIVIGFGVDLVHQVLRVCLMAAAFDLVVARVSGRSAAPARADSSSAPPLRPGPPVRRS